MRGDRGTSGLKRGSPALFFGREWDWAAYEFDATGTDDGAQFAVWRYTSFGCEIGRIVAVVRRTLGARCFDGCDPRYAWETEMIENTNHAALISVRRIVRYCEACSGAGAKP